MIGSMGYFTVGVAWWEMNWVVMHTIVSLNLAGLVHMRLSKFLEMLRSAWNIHMDVLSHTVVS